MIRSFIEWLKGLRGPSMCYHPAEASIDESGDGTVVEWECIFCGRIRIQDDHPA